MCKRLNILQHKTSLLTGAILFAGAVIIGLLVAYQSQHGVIEEKSLDSAKTTPTMKALYEPMIDTKEVLNGLFNPWEIAFLPDGSLLVNERGGVLSRVTEGIKTVVADIRDVYAVGEGGLTGLAVDADFQQNRYIYTCFNASTASGLDVRLVRWRLHVNNTELEERADIITGIPSNASGRHSGCRIKTAVDGTIWIGTGDAAKAAYPQDPQSLGGKILHVTRDGMPAAGNLPTPFDPRIFSYGHRNVQGIVLFDEPRNDVVGFSVEHGSDRDDEVNLLRRGNFGWAPRVSYVEHGVPMTDFERFPDALSAVWSSGSPTIAPSGATFLNGEAWGAWSGSLAVAVLKDKHLRIMKFDDEHKLILEKKLLTDFGRIRTAVNGPDESLYVTTDNGKNDKIIQITPSQPR